MLLGEAQSKCEHVSGIPILPQVAQALYQVALARGALATTAIEGNTLTEEQVLLHLDGKLDLPPSKEYLRREVENIIRAYNDIGVRVLRGSEASLTKRWLLEMNASVLEGLPLDEGVVPGRIRGYSVGVGRYRAAPAEDCDHLLDRLCEWLAVDFEAPSGHETAFGILRAILAHLYIAWIHPFGDGNGRTARLAEFQILLSAGIPATACHLLSNYYNATRAEYYRQLDAASRTPDVLPFVEYAVRGFVEGLRDHIGVIQRQQLSVHWINYVHERFRGLATQAHDRRRRVVIDLSHAGTVPAARIRHLSPRIAEAYAGKTDKTIQRDINALVQMELVERTPEGIRARPEIMSAFIVPRRPPEAPPEHD
jgi:Fic family protein